MSPVCYLIIHEAWYSPLKSHNRYCIHSQSCGGNPYTGGGIQSSNLTSPWHLLIQGRVQGRDIHSYNLTRAWHLFIQYHTGLTSTHAILQRLKIYPYNLVGALNRHLLSYRGLPPNRTILQGCDIYPYNHTGGMVHNHLYLLHVIGSFLAIFRMQRE